MAVLTVPGIEGMGWGNFLAWRTFTVNLDSSSVINKASQVRLTKENHPLIDIDKERYHLTL